MLTRIRAMVARRGKVAVAILAVIIVLGAWGVRTHRVHVEGAKPGGSTCQALSGLPASDITDCYDQAVLSLGPAMYLTMGHPAAATEPDLSGNGNTGTYMPVGSQPAGAVLPNGDLAARFDGQKQYLQVPSAADLSIPTTGSLTVQAWIEPTTLQFPREEATGYVYILGKGTPNQQEYAMRMYSKTNTENPVRPNRISGYAWNLSGGLGSGAYFQDSVQTGAWIMVTLVYDAQPSAGWPHGYVAIYKNNQLRQQISLAQYNVTPQASGAPFRVGTRNFDSFFQGAIGKVAVFDRGLTQQQIATIYSAM